jgi:hypothetical protein
MTTPALNTARCHTETQTEQEVRGGVSRFVLLDRITGYGCGTGDSMTTHTALQSAPDYLALECMAQCAAMHLRVALSFERHVFLLGMRDVQLADRSKQAEQVKQAEQANPTCHTDVADLADLADLADHVGQAGQVDPTDPDGHANQPAQAPQADQDKSPKTSKQGRPSGAQITGIVVCTATRTGETDSGASYTVACRLLTEEGGPAAVIAHGEVLLSSLPYSERFPEQVLRPHYEALFRTLTGGTPPISICTGARP